MSKCIILVLKSHCYCLLKFLSLDVFAIVVCVWYVYLFVVELGTGLH